MRSIFKQNSLQSIPAVPHQLTPSLGINKDVAHIYGECSQCKPTNTQKKQSFGSAYEIHVDPVGVCVLTARSCDQRGHYWRQLDLSGAAREPEVCPSLSITIFFLLPSFFSMSILGVSSHLS